MESVQEVKTEGFNLLLNGDNANLEAYQRALSDLAILAVTDLKGKILDVNEKFTNISGFSREELIGNTHHLINSGFHSKLFFKEMYRTISSGKTWRGEIRNKKKDGTFYWVDTSISPIMCRNGKPKGYFAVRFDITEKKRYEEELIQRQHDLDKLNNFKNLMISLISHDLKSPVASLSGIVNLYNNHHLSPSEIEKSFKTLETKLGDVSMLLDNLMNWAYSHYDDLSVLKEPVCCEPIIRSVFENYLPAANKKNIRLETNISDSCTEIIMDKYILKAVLRNLIDNAIKFTNKNGVVSLKLNKKDDNVVISVKDNGIGMDKQTINKVISYNKFSTRGTEGESGSGIGMYVCKDFIDKLHGSLLIESEPGKGTEVIISIPIVK